MPSAKQAKQDLFDTSQFGTHLFTGQVFDSAPTVDGYIVCALLVEDDDSTPPDKRQDGFWPSLDPKSPGYIGAKSKKTLANQMNHARRVMRAWDNDEWSYVGVVVTVWRTTGELERITGKYDHALWGVDCNYPSLKHGRVNKTRNHYIAEVANELGEEALAEVRAADAELRQTKAAYSEAATICEAAPDMLAALKRMVALAKSRNLMGDEVNEASAAISKAEGV